MWSHPFLLLCRVITQPILNALLPPEEREPIETTAPAPKTAGIGGSVSNKYDKFTSSSRQSEDALKISQKKTKSSEVNVGGLPNADWREWAASAKQRPMPIMHGEWYYCCRHWTFL